MYVADFWILSPEDVGAAPILKKGSKTEGKFDPKKVPKQIHIKGLYFPWF